MKEQLERAFAAHYNTTATHVYFSPGRVNLIGEHIDYNGGWVMPCAISYGTYLLVAPNNDGVFRFKSLNFNEEAEIPLQQHYEKNGSNWYNYPIGVINYFVQHGKVLQGLDMLYYGNIPIASGLSSSASIELATAYALNDLFDAGYDRLKLVKLSQWVENEFIGLNSGIMDQFAVAFGKKDKALMLNCDTLEYQTVDSSLGDHILAVINTNKPRKLAESKYNERVEECSIALKALQTVLPVHNLCEIDTATFEQHKHVITDQTVLHRATHVIAENERVKLAATALNANDLAEFGRLMYASHNSLRDLYEVSGKELDTVVDYCRTNTDVAGARMTGAGFGGCAIALVKRSAFDKFAADVTTYYESVVGYKPSVYDTHIGDGVGLLHSNVDALYAQ